MREYGVVSPRFWIGNTGRTLRGDQPAQVLALYLMTGPHASMTGLFYCPVTYMAQETGLTMQGASKALQRLVGAGFCDYDEACEWVFVRTMIRWQVGTTIKPGDRRLVKIRRDVEQAPSRYLQSMFIKLHGEAFSITVDMSSEQDQEQDQDQDQDHGGIEGACMDAPSKPHHEKAEDVYPEDFKAIWAIYPKRSGSNPKKTALDAWQSRIREGRTTPADALDAVRMYRAWCEATGKIGQETVMQAATFFGKQKEGYLQDWSLPVARGPVNGQKTWADIRDERTDQAVANVLRRRGILCDKTDPASLPWPSETPQDAEE